MNSFKGLILNGNYYTKDWILKHYHNLNSHQFTDLEIKTLHFCAQWLCGVQEFIVQTSGSTGKPKPIRLKREQMILSARITGRALKLKREDRAFVCLSPAYIGGIMMLVRGLELDLELTIVNPSSNPFESINVYESSFDFTAFVPLQLQNILASGPQNIAILDRMKAILVGGAPVSAALLKEVQQVRAPVYQTFGMTETISHIALRRLNGPKASENYKPLPEVEIATDPRGCLTIKSPLTNHQRIITNDLVEIHPDGSFIWLGRIDNVINTGGVKVQAEKVEKAIEESLHEIDGGRYAEHEFFVGPLPDKKYGQVVAAIFEGPNFSQDIQNKLLAKLSEKLNKYEIPKNIYFVKAFLRTPNGKIDRRAILKIFAH